MIDVKKVRENFIIYQKQPNLCYLDSAASSLKVKTVVEQTNMYYHTLGVNVHRGAYDLAYEATKLYEDARETVKKFIHAESEENIIFTRGTTSSLNLVAQGLSHILKPGDEIITSELEHHSSVLPWMMVAKKVGAKLIYIPLTEEGKITVQAFESVLTDKTKIVAITHVSNAMGYLTPIEDIAKLAHQKQAIVILDGAQSVPHMKVDVQQLGVDFLAFSGHKMFGPSGVGVLYGKKELLNMMEPYEYGGEMADEVFKDRATWKDAPLRFEAGTPVISGAIGLAEAIRYIDSLGIEAIEAHTSMLHRYALDKMKKIEGLVIYNPHADMPIINFNVKGVHPHDIATTLDQYQINVRAGHHCAQLVTKFLGVNSTLRASFHIYNTIEDCDLFIKGLNEAIQFFSGF
jgi:cysteine desulfurase / selenocysteine lyase